MSLAIVILAAGKGSRMKSSLPKVLHEVGGAPLVQHCLMTAGQLKSDRVVVVTGHGGDQVRNAVGKIAPEVTFAAQEDQLGTAHAVDQARDALADHDGYMIVIYGDSPFIRAETISQMKAECEAGPALCILGFEAADPAKYGRLVMGEDGLQAIVEAKEATPEQLAITLCNSGVMCGKTSMMLDLIQKVDNQNAKGEYYLTDLPGLARAKGGRCAVVTCDEAETLGVDSRIGLAKAEALFQAKARMNAMTNGATLRDPNTVYFSYDTKLGQDVVIEPYVQFLPGVDVADNVHIKAHSTLESCSVAPGAVIGPYARLRPGADIGPKARIGNFVEVKNATLAQGAKVNHLTYIGDAEIGEGANIGAGTITCNYDGVFKHKTKIGARAFIGSNSSLVAPVTIGDDALIGSGSVITSDVAEGDLAVGRARQVSKPGWGKRMMDKLRAKKAEGK
ncbi:MAG: bifunctional UDP-N-acetylglucosamine diphosphorylase/glucosamine-1-phosphate N-acetyltransferase GlmU [Pseudomonadota bacterium]